MKIQKTVMIKAHALRHLFETFSAALVAAWKLVKLQVRMKTDRVSFRYKKVDGSIREAVGTLDVEYDRKGTGHSTEETFSYWDVAAESFRSFKITNLI